MPRINLDIYSIVEATQELHFGNQKDLNVNRIELAKITTREGEEREKLYMSPTKVRGVARRALLYKLNELGDENVKSCGMPATCGKCDLCKLFGGLSTTSGGEEGAIASRVFQAGGVAIQEATPDIKQRLSSPTYLLEDGVTSYDQKKIEEHLKKIGIKSGTSRLSKPMPYEKEYVQASALFPIYWHSHLLDPEKGERKMSEPQMVAFSFLEMLKRIGAGHPKGAEIVHEKWLKDEKEPMLVVDIYIEPLGKRPVISPAETDIKAAFEEFTSKALKSNNVEGKFERYLGNEGEQLLRNLASGEPVSSQFIA